MKQLQEAEMAVNEGSSSTPGAVSATAPHTFEQLINRQVVHRGLDLVLHVHVPKASGNTVRALFQQNGFTALHFDMTTGSFFEIIPEDRFMQRYRAPPPRLPNLLTGHFRLDHLLLRRLWMPHVIATNLRDPVKRILSHYNFTVRRTGTPWHSEVSSGAMSFTEYAGKIYEAIGPQYQFFDDTGQGTFAPTGSASVERCLANLTTRVGLLGLTERFDEFCVLVGYLLGHPNILAVPMGNVTIDIANPTNIPLKTALTESEQEQLTALLKDDIWFYGEALKEYERRVSDPRVRAVFAEALPLVHSYSEGARQISAIRDPGDPSRLAFEPV